MAYTYITFSQLKTQLALRLDDPTEVYWVDTELGLHLTEALRTFGLTAGFWRERGTISASPALAFYDINPNLSNGSENILQPTVTDQDIVQQLQYALLEKATSQTTWTGTEMFTYRDLANAIQNRLNQFMSDTGIVVNRSLVNVISPPSGREVLGQSTIDVRRAAWLGSSPEAYYTTLWREDERTLTSANQDWSVSQGQPIAYSIMAPPPLRFQIAPPPQSNGQLELLTVDSTTLDPANTATVLGIPDDLTPAIKWGALADLLGMDGVARDLVRASFSEQRYRQYVALARMLPVIVHAEINGVPLLAVTLQEIDSGDPNWQNSVASSAQAVDTLVLAAPNLIALSAIPNTAYSVTLDVVRRTPTYNDIDTVQIGREQLDMILDYAEHLALFKVAGAEWHATERQAANFLLQSLTYNSRISAAARAAFSAADQSQRQKQQVPRRTVDLVGHTFGVGASKAGEDAGK
jgi:hypothetical protein